MGKTMLFRQYRVRADTLESAVEKAHEKCPEVITNLKIWLIFEDWWECQVACQEVNGHGKQAHDFKKHFDFYESKLYF